MAYLGVAPEALIERSDSKNPATTCKGITQAGRPCRRSIQGNLMDDASRSTKRRNDNGVMAILDGGDAAAFFCHDHKDQADALVAKLKQQKRTKIVPLQHKSSIDTLAEKVGVIDLDAEVERRKKQRIPRPGKPPEPQKIKKRNTLPQEWQNMQSPLMSVPHDVVQSYIGTTKPNKTQFHSGSRYGRSNVKASWSCCIRADDDDSPPVRRRHEPHRPRPSNQTRPHSDARPEGPIMQQNIKPAATYQQGWPAPGHTPLRPVSSPQSQTANYLSFIPSNLAPTTASALLAELSKPISSADEAGYIYIFWLTPESEQSKPDDDVASSLLDDDDYMADTLGSRPRDRVSGQQREQRTAQALQRYASVRRGPAEPRKILLKIGRASNVHRRMSQWTKQCGQQITLVRYYPYHRDPAATAASPGGPMVPHVHKVERLIQLELINLRAVDKGPCKQCGREHREWFEVEATKKAIKEVDRTIRRWVDWAEKIG